MSLLRSAWALGTANFALLAVQAITTLSLGVVLQPEELGVFFLGLSFAQLFSTFATFRFDSAYPAAPSLAELVPLVVLSAAGIVVTIALQSAVFSALSAYGLFEFDAMPSWSIWIIVPLTAALAIVQLGRYWVIRHSELGKIGVATYVRAFATVLLRGAVIVAALGDSVTDLPFGVVLLLAELLIASITATLLIPKFDVGLLRRSMHFSTLRSTLARNWKFPAIEAPSSVLDSLALNAPIFLVTHFFGLTATASFGLAFRALAVPIGQLALALTDVLQTQYATYLRAGQLQDFRRLFHRTSRTMLLGGTLFCILLYFTLQNALAFAFGEKLDTFAAICVVISPWITMNVVVNINSRVLQLLKRQELKLVYDVFSILAVPTLIAIQYASSPQLLGFIGLLTVSQVLGYAIYLALMTRAVVTAERAADRRAQTQALDRGSSTHGRAR